MHHEDPKSKIVRLIKESSPRVHEPENPAISVQGDANITAGRDINLNPLVRPRVTVKTGDGVVDAAQKAELQRLISEWVDARVAVRRTKFGFPAAWGAFNQHFGINKYAELPMESFGDARAWLQRQVAIISSMPSARRKMPGWRGRTIGAIKARAKNQLGDPHAYGAYIQQNFGKDSLAHLTDNELQATRLYVFGLPRP